MEFFNLLGCNRYDAKVITHSKKDKVRGMCLLFLIAAVGIVAVAVAACGKEQRQNGNRREWRKFYEKGEYGAAVSSLNKAINLAPKDETAYIDRGIVFQAKSEYDKAIGDFDTAVRIDPRAVRAYVNRAVAYAEKKNYDKAIADCDEAIRLDPKCVTAYVNRGAAYKARGEYDRAVADCDEAVRWDSKNVLAYINRAVAYEAKGQYGKAVVDCSKAIQIDAMCALAYSNRGIAYQSTGKYNAAVADYEEALRLELDNPKMWQVWNSLAWLFATCPETTVRNGKKAVECATKSCELSKWQEAAPMDTLAAAYAEVGEYEQAGQWEGSCLKMENLPEKMAGEARSRLLLYQAHKAFHSERPLSQP